MSHSIDIEPSKSPLSREYRDWVFNMAKDIAAFNRLRPFLEMSVRDALGGGEGDAGVFPALITSGSISGPYTFVETTGPNSPMPKPEGRAGTAYNSLEVNLECETFIPPGITADCLEELRARGVDWECLPIIDSVVMMALDPGGAPQPEGRLFGNDDPDDPKDEGDEGDEGQSEGSYWFSVPIPICIRCSGGGGDDPGSDDDDDDDDDNGGDDDGDDGDDGPGDHGGGKGFVYGDKKTGRAV